MPINSIIPKSSRLCITGAIFKAVFNNPTVGKYDFTNYKVGGDRLNVSVPIGLAMNPSYLYFFHQINFSLSIDEGIFLSSISENTVPTLSVRDSTNRKNIFYAPFRMIKYLQNSALDSYHFNTNKNAEMIADFQCVLNQSADLIGVSEIYAQVSFTIYEISQHKYIDEFKRQS